MLSILFDVIWDIVSTLIFIIDSDYIFPISSTSIYPTLDEDFIFSIFFYNNTSLSEAYTGKFTLIAFLLHGIPQEEVVQVWESLDKSLVATELSVVSSNSPSAFRVIMLSGEYSQSWSYSVHISSMV